MATQNIYDDPRFFSAYKHLRDTDTGLNGVLEQPALRALLPPLAGRRVLDLGCGMGDFAREARQAGAVHVTGVDLSERMLAEARARTPDAQVTFVRSSIEDFASDHAAWDLVVSSLALHYVADYAGALRKVYRWLAPQGHFVFSIEHPIVTAHPVGWVSDAAGAKQHWPVDHYADEGARSTHWFVDGVVKYHRTVATTLNGLLDAGFTLVRVDEPVPPPEVVAQRPDTASELRRPPFLLAHAVKAS